jgi:NTE family protein
MGAKEAFMAGELAVVLSGGGAKGAFQVGVLDELVTNRRVRFDIFAGVSTGSIQALGGAMNDMPGLLNEWLSIRGNGDIYRKRTLGVVEALLGKPSLYTTKPLQEKLRAYADPAKLRAARRILRVGVVNMATGQYLDVDGSNDRIADWIYASCAQPPFFPPLESRNADGVIEQWVDGGVRNVTPLATAMHLRPRAVLVVLASPPKPVPTPGKTYDDLVAVALRASGILVSEVSDNDVANAMLINDLLGAREAQRRQLADLGITGADAERVMAPLNLQLDRYKFAPVRIIHPPMGFDAGDTLEFKPATIRSAIDEGRRVVTEQWTSLKGFLGV